MMTDQSHPEPELPENVAFELKQRWGFTPAVRPETDAAILAAAAQLLAARSKSARTLSRLRRSAAVLSAIVAALLLFMVWQRGNVVTQGPSNDLTAVQSSPPERREPRIVNDIDGDGRVDILDAYLVARAVDRGDVFRSEFDANRDGSLSLADADLIAANAVRLDDRKPFVF